MLAGSARAQTHTLSTLVTLDAAGNIYGTTSGGSTHGYGTVYKIAAGTGTLTTLAKFNGTGNGEDPLSPLLLDASGNLYGTTSGGGACNAGRFSD